MKLDGMLLEIGDFTENANTVKTIVLSALAKNNVINEEQWKEYKDNWQVIVVKKSWFKKIISGDDWSYHFIKIKI